MLFIKMQQSSRKLIFGRQLLLLKILVQCPQLLIIEADGYVYLFHRVPPCCFNSFLHRIIQIIFLLTRVDMYAIMYIYGGDHFA